MVYGLVLVPRVTRLLATVFGILTLSDHLHQTYKVLTKRAQQGRTPIRKVSGVKYPFKG